MEKKSNCKYILYRHSFSLYFIHLVFPFPLFLIDKMAFEVIAESGKRKLQLPFMRRTDKRPKIRFTNYDKYDRREALKTFLDPAISGTHLTKKRRCKSLRTTP